MSIWTPQDTDYFDPQYYSDVISFSSISAFEFYRLRRVREQYLGSDPVLRTHLFDYGNKINEILDTLEKMAETLGILKDTE